MNPILPLNHHVPDVEAHAWRDGRIHLYGSYDLPGNTSYCSFEYRVFSSDDMENWTDHGISFQSDGPNSGVPWGRHALFAPDCICRDGKYYLYFCTSDRGEGVAVSDVPEGPFTDTREIIGAHMDGIDPAIFIDDDGQAYYYWGQFELRGGRLKPNMYELAPDTINRNLISEEEHGFHEGSSMRKRGDLYYLVYTDTSRGKATCLSYATSASPLGPFEKRGVIIDNDGCDPETWNNHGSIAEFNGRWYIFYHRSSQGSKFSRRVCVEPIEFLEDGSIPEVEMTTQGVSGPLAATTPLEACRACLLSGNVRTQRLDDDQGEFLAMAQNGDWAAYKYLDFGDGLTSFSAQVASNTYGGTLEVRLDSPDGELIGQCDIPRTYGWYNWLEVSCTVAPSTGVHALYLGFRGQHGGRTFNLERFRFGV